MTTSTQLNTIIILRHGIRLDIDDEHYHHYLKRPHDMPLSIRGITQAKETGQFLKSEPIDHIFASPFFRTLQTAHFVAEAVGRTVNIESGLIEMLKPEWFPAYPTLMSLEEASSVFSSVNPGYRPLFEPEYPETDYNVGVFERIKSTLNVISEQYGGTILIVGHGASTQTAARVLAHPESPDGFDGKMCALNKYVRQGDKWNLEYATTKHLSAESVE
ncbi:broad specificity phosphatase PhoE [Paenibacillus castaneae]|uniref:histidine phosphatase family protein n=1 Tax=Paenibacillus castaneae TaxID=474957 RepID=UPI000C9AFAF1|nr:histidine phosphatase family protein [Paenibacillus castaneae]NIK78068.1 broad specificity phosphatase PhoE [Paenibacillus castaneae]